MRTTTGAVGNASAWTRRRMSQSSASASSSRAGSVRGNQRCPQVPSSRTAPASSRPASVSAYVGPSSPASRVITPPSTSSRRRADSMVRETRGMPRRSSPKRVLPQSSSRTMRNDQRSPSRSRARANEQNCP
jgi:hypothetical protein